MDSIYNYIKDMIEGVEIVPECNGGITVRVQDQADIPAVLARIADAMSDWELLDLQITTHPSRFGVFIQELDSPNESEEEDDSHIREGMLIAYRMHFVTVLRIEEDGAWVAGPYGEEQKLDWEDIEQYNPGIKH